MICPRDNIPLIQRRLEDHHFHFCERCHGLWFTAEGLKKVLAAKNRPVIVKPGEEPWVSHSECETPGNCPVDGKTPMTLDTRQGVCVDVCHEHKGIWLDSGELEKVAGGLSRAVTSGGNKHSIVGEIVGEIFFHATAEASFDVAIAGVEIAADAAGEVVPEIAEAVVSVIVEIIADLLF